MCVQRSYTRRDNERIWSMGNNEYKYVIRYKLPNLELWQDELCLVCHHIFSVTLCFGIYNYHSLSLLGYDADNRDVVFFCPQLCIPVELYSPRPVGDRLCNWRWANPADNTPKQVPVSGLAGRPEGGFVSVIPA